MKAYSLPAIIIATICLTFALSDTLAWARRNRKNSDIAFILVCLGGAAFCLCCAGEYSVDSPLQSIFWLKGEVIASTFSGFALLWFVAETTGLIHRRIVAGFLVWAVLAGLTQVFDLGDLTWMADRPLVLKVDLPFGLDFVYQEVGRGILLYIIALSGFAAQLYLFWVVARYWRGGKRKEAAVLFAALGFIIAAQIVDFLIGIGLFSFVFLLEYAWLGTIMVVGLKRSNDSIEAASTRKKLEKTDQALQVSQATLATIIDSTDDLIWSVDHESLKLLSFNQAFLRHFSRYSRTIPHTGMHFGDLLDSPAEQETWIGFYHQGLAAGSFSMEHISSMSGEEKVFLVGINTLRRHGQVFGLSVFAHDITLRKKSEEQVRRALAEKEVLLKEVHHRTKNNMNVIVSLLRLQSAQMPDQLAKDAFGISIDRIIAMAMVHDRLYLSGDLSLIDLKDYLEELANRLLGSHSLPSNRISLVSRLESIHVMIETAINCGMIVNELVTNALKHAFEPGAKGEITLVLTLDDTGEVVLVVSDNGKGLPEGFDTLKDGNLGFRLIQTLAHDSLHASLEFLPGPGFGCKVRFDPATE